MSKDYIVCKKCNRELPLIDYYPSFLIAYNYVCKDCQKVVKREQYKKRKERLNANSS